MRNFIPWQFKSFMERMLDAPGRLAWMRERQQIGLQPAKDEIILDFGFEPGGMGFMHGGKVKLLHLQKEFTCNPQKASFIYLVSSALPKAAEAYIFWAKHQGAKFIWNQNGVAYPAWAGAESERYNHRMRRLREMADYVVYQTEFCQNTANHFLGSSEKPSSVLMNPVDLERFKPFKKKSTSPLCLLAAGTHGYRERVIYTLDCLATLKKKGLSVKLTLAGKCEWQDAENNIYQVVQALGLRDSFERQISFDQSEAQHLYQKHDILLHPKFMDPCPTVVAEALACGLPIVGSRSGGLPEMTTPACARLSSVPPEHDNFDEMFTPSGEVLAEGVLSLMEDLPSASAAARQCAEERFSEKAWLNAHRMIFEKLLPFTSDTQKRL
ncbi:MAG: glycosyltransferase family 4 protein [Chthoniobacterales bacterium]